MKTGFLQHLISITKIAAQHKNKTISPNTVKEIANLLYLWTYLLVVRSTHVASFLSEAKRKIIQPRYISAAVELEAKPDFWNGFKEYDITKHWKLIPDNVLKRQIKIWQKTRNRHAIPKQYTFSDKSLEKFSQVLQYTLEYLLWYNDKINTNIVADNLFWMQRKPVKLEIL